MTKRGKQKPVLPGSFDPSHATPQRLNAAAHATKKQDARRPPFLAHADATQKAHGQRLRRDDALERARVPRRHDHDRGLCLQSEVFHARIYVLRPEGYIYKTTTQADDDEHDGTRGGVLAALPLPARRDPENGAAGLRPLEENRLLAQGPFTSIGHFIGRRGLLARFIKVTRRWFTSGARAPRKRWQRVLAVCRARFHAEAVPRTAGGGGR